MLVLATPLAFAQEWRIQKWSATPLISKDESVCGAPFQLSAQRDSTEQPTPRSGRIFQLDLRTVLCSAQTLSDANRQRRCLRHLNVRASMCRWADLFEAGR